MGWLMLRLVNTGLGKTLPYNNNKKIYNNNTNFVLCIISKPIPRILQLLKIRYWCYICFMLYILMLLLSFGLHYNCGIVGCGTGECDWLSGGSGYIYIYGQSFGNKTYKFSKYFQPDFAPIR